MRLGPRRPSCAARSERPSRRSAQPSPLAPSGAKSPIPARRARAAFSAASESRAIKWTYLIALASDPHFTLSEKTARVVLARPLPCRTATAGHNSFRPWALPRPAPRSRAFKSAPLPLQPNQTTPLPPLHPLDGSALPCASRCLLPAAAAAAVFPPRRWVFIKGLRCRRCSRTHTCCPRSSYRCRAASPIHTHTHTTTTTTATTHTCAQCTQHR